MHVVPTLPKPAEKLRPCSLTGLQEVRSAIQKIRTKEVKHSSTQVNFDKGMYHVVMITSVDKMFPVPSDIMNILERRS